MVCAGAGKSDRNLRCFAVPFPKMTLVQQALARLSSTETSCNWTVGECASKWVQAYVPGRTDADFGVLIGLDGEQVRQRRVVWEKFGDSHSGRKLSWTHFRECLNWADAYECLDWANEHEATVAEMKAWRRSQGGEDLCEPAVAKRSCE